MIDKAITGIVLIEVLVASMLVSFALLPLLSYQMCNVRSAHESIKQSIAIIQLNNLQALLLSKKQFSSREAVVHFWNQQNYALLRGHGTVSTLSDHQCVANLHWIYHVKYRLITKLVC